MLRRTSLGHPRSLRRILAGLLAVFSLLFILAPSLPSSSAHAASSAAAPVYGGTLVLANQVDADSLDPSGNPVNEVIWIDQNVYEKLVQADSTGTKIVPQLASSWTISNDGLTYTFHLRNARFQDGTAVTGADVVYSLTRAIANPKGWGFLLSAVKGVAAYSAGKAKSVSGITAPDARTVVIALSHGWAPLLADLAIYANSIMPAALLKKEGAKFFNHPVGSGPYQITNWNKGTTITLKRNPYWWGAKPYLDGVTINVVPNDNTRVLQLQGKQADIVENPPANLLSTLQATPNVQVALFPSTRVDFIQLDEHFAPFKDKSVRQAMNYAVDRAALVRIVLQGHGKPATSFMPPMFGWDPNLTGYTYNLAKAKQLMAKSKYPHGFNTYLIVVSNDVVGNGVAVILKSELAQIGINVSINNYELITAYHKEDGGASQMGERYWTNDIIDPDEVVSFAVDPNAGAHSFNTSYNNPAVTKLVHQAQVELNPTKRQQLYYQIQAISNNDAPLINLFYSPYRYAMGSWVHGFHASPLGAYQLQNVWMSAKP